MVRHLHPSFMRDAREYEQALTHWQRLWESIDPLRKQLSDWRTPWLSTKAVDGSELNDGNPIFSAYSPSLKKGIRVIQHQPASEAVEFACWLDTFGGAPTDPDTIDELVVAVALSDESSILARDVMNAWVFGPIEMTVWETLIGAQRVLESRIHPVDRHRSAA